MQAVILAGGFGTRLSEETGVRPKPMVEIGGRPIIWHIMKIYSAHGINDFVVAAGYKSHILKEYFATYFLRSSDVTFDLATNEVTTHSASSEPWRVTVVETGDDTMSGGRIKRVASYLKEDTFCLTYGDCLARLDIGKLIDFHREQGVDATLTAIQPPGRFGALGLQEDAARIESFHEKPSGDGGWVNGGFFVLNRRAIDYIEGDATSWEREPLERLARDGKLAAYRHEGTGRTWTACATRWCWRSSGPPATLPGRCGSPGAHGHLSMIDLHSHVLPGLDDGARTLDEACELVRVLQADGVHTVAATPHVREDYPTRPEEIEHGAAALRRELKKRGLEIELVTGAEVALDPAATLDRDSLVRLSYGGRGGYLLLEFPYTEWPFALDAVVHRLLGMGLTPVLAHPERNHAVHRNPDRLQEVVATGALVQVTSSSILGTFGSDSKKCGLELVRQGTAHLLASDAHDPVSRDVRLSRAVAVLGDDELGKWLTEDVPAAILASAPVPERPLAPQSRLGRLRDRALRRS